jgi:MFS family permease
MVLRGLLGISEAAFCGVPFYLSFFFRREELAFRTGIFIAAAPLATAFASSVAFLITSLSSILPIAPWRLLFLVEGFPSVLVALYCWNYIADRPGTAWFLSKKERILAVLRLHELGSTAGKEETEKEDDNIQTEASHVQWREIIQTGLDPKCYLMSVSFFLVVLPGL